MTAVLESMNGVRLEVSGLRRSFGGRPVIRDVSFQVDPGEVFVLMGPSGSGKSVLLKHLIGLEKPGGGEIRIENRSIQNPAVRSQYRLAMVFQSGALLSSLTVAQNVGLYLREHRIRPEEEIEPIVRRSLALVDLRGVEDQYPAELSGGMIKRAAIARALVINPQLILYDEPTSELDPLTAAKVGDEMEKLNHRSGVTSIVVTHDRELAFRIADRIAFIQEGRILRIGAPVEIRDDPDPFLQKFLHAGGNPPRKSDPNSL